MVQSILEGRKTQTRRVVKPQPDYFINCVHGKPLSIGLSGSGEFYGTVTNGIDNSICAPYNVGDVLWVRETFQYIDFAGENNGYVYKASENGLDWENNCKEWKWKPSIFMPKQACRIFLKLKTIRVERLKSITREDALSEGIERDPVSGTKFKNYIDNSTTYNEQTSFFSLWEMINGKRSLEANPYVFVYEFECIEKPLDFIV